MFEGSLIIKYLSVKDSFLHINPNLKFLETGTYVRVNSIQEFYFSIGDVSIELEDNFIGLNSLFAKSLNIDNNTLVRVSEIKNLPIISRLTVFPLNPHEYEVMEMLANNIQDTLLSQIRVVFKGEKIVIWVGSNINITVCVDSIHPVSPGVVDFLTELHIEQPVRKIENTESLSTQTKACLNSLDWKLFSGFIETNPENTVLSKYLTKPSEFICRVIPLSKLPLSDIFSTSIQPFTAFLSKKTIPEDQLSSNICQISLVTEDTINKKVFVKLIFLEDIQEIQLKLFNELFVGQEIFDIYECQLGVRVVLEPIEKPPPVNEIHITASKNYTVDILEVFKKYLADGSDETFVLNSEIPIDIGDNIICSPKFYPEDSEFCVVDNNLVRNCKYVLNIDNIHKITQKENPISMPILEDIANVKKILNDSIKAITDISTDNVLLTGRAGTGKSTILNTVAKYLSNYPYLIFTKHINCKRIKGKTMDSLEKFMSVTFSELILHQPSLLILDDLHVLCENACGEDDAPNTLYFNRISEMLYILLRRVTGVNKINILASSESTDKLNKNIYSSRGTHLFKNIFSIEDFVKVDRIAALKFSLKDYKLEDYIMNELAIKTEGFVFQDLINFCKKIVFEIYKHGQSNISPKVIKPEYVDVALKNTYVMALQNIQFHSAGENDFSTIGGLNKVKKVLLENLLWPGLYPNIFSNAPLRLQSGLLLFGPPGTGKTLIAGAVAKQCGMRLISIKGPELLSKYIGASEQAVRDTFQKAQSAKPCILFFDEFDSLAPKRGHDNTGVTDRVVNQLLTQLDGVESLTGVCVLAATSRPDLLDSALLRPGRLDKQLFCPLPNEDERFDILKVLLKNLSLDDNVSLDVIAKKTNNYSGADLQSLLYCAHMLTIDYTFETDKDIVIDSKITQTHLEDALQRTKPSLSNEERLKYEKIYAKFQSGSITEDFKTSSKATLA
ncbi:peroxisomal ATPase PEX1 [Diorhabda sublineata]|uniref:peroxisomal ATPase PEX1 n=1 Tax=Diorhabda sublineata TaxID=1163346 RepID=UPI0024E09C9A|nr:peroxisomal ATPase PEX1 [Diorhabda sublineata]